MPNMDVVVRSPDVDEPRRRSVVSSLVRRPSFVIAAVIMLGWILAPIAVRLAGADPYGQAGSVNHAPDAAHLLGTDSLSRDVLVRLLAGAGPILIVAPTATLVACLVGSVLGLVAGYRRGVVDDLLMRSFDVLNAFPGIVGILLIAAAFGRSKLTILIAIATVFAPTIARTVRSAVLVEMGKDYVEAATTQGETTARILLAELLPNVTPSLLIEGLTRLGQAIFFSAGLSFLNLGSRAPSPDWGLSVSENRVYVQTAWWTVAFPALAILTLVVAVNLVADNTREVLSR